MKFFALIAFCILITIRADLPVHCLKSQVQGNWSYVATVPQTKHLNELYKLTCGHHLPSQESSSFHFNMNPSLFSIRFSVDLQEDDSAVLTYQDGSILKGKWTMVYDEGFDIVFHDHTPHRTSYFAFNRYGQNNQSDPGIKSKWISYCYETLVGWYHAGDKWGCFYGIKEGHQRHEVTNGEATNKQIVVQGSITPVNSYVPDNHPETQTFLQGHEITHNDIHEFVEADIVENSTSQVSFPTNTDSFLEAATYVKGKLQLNSKFTDHARFVEMLNKSSNSMWTAENYKEFSSMTLEELNAFAGRKKNSGEFHSHSKKFTKKRKEPAPKKENKFSLAPPEMSYTSSPQDTTLPENFNWIQYATEARNQGSCGSCFITSTLGMLEARMRIKYPDLVRKYFSQNISLIFSLDHVLKCSYYNQGCEGGYAYLVLKFFSEFELLHSDCFARSSVTCEKRCGNEMLNRLKFSVKEYGYVGGSYGRSNERNMMEEVYRNGPVVVSFEPDYSFMFYKKGIYQTPNNNWMMNNLTRPEWEKVDHSVLLVGWGVEEVNGEKVKYWILQNSWGKHWGEGGFMRFIRGTDHLGIESNVESGMPSLEEIQ